MKVYRTKGGYFYKELKNGKKLEFQKNNIKNFVKNKQLEAVERVECVEDIEQKVKRVLLVKLLLIHI